MSTILLLPWIAFSACFSGRRRSGSIVRAGEPQLSCAAVRARAAKNTGSGCLEASRKKASGAVTGERKSLGRDLISAGRRRRQFWRPDSRWWNLGRMDPPPAAAGAGVPASLRSCVPRGRLRCERGLASRLGARCWCGFCHVLAPRDVGLLVWVQTLHTKHATWPQLNEKVRNN